MFAIVIKRLILFFGLQLLLTPVAKGSLGQDIEKMLNQGVSAEQSLNQWFEYIDQNESVSGANALAYQALLEFRNGLYFTGLYRVKNLNPRKISSKVKERWTSEVYNRPFIFRYIRPSQMPKWVLPIQYKTIFSKSFFPTYDVTKKSELRKINKAIGFLSPSSETHHWLVWQRSLAQSYQGMSHAAIKGFKSLLKLKPLNIPLSELHLNLARTYYQAKNWDKALIHYSKIERGSEFWFQALEERAWTHIRKKQLNKALALLINSHAPSFLSLVEPESFFVENFVNLNICDYPAVFKVSKKFKSVYSQRIAALEKLEKGESSLILHELKSRLSNGRITMEQLGPVSQKLPRGILRDGKFQKLIHQQVYFNFEISQLRKSSSKALQNNLLGLSREYESYENRYINKLNGLDSSLNKRLKQLAKFELRDFKRIVQSLHVVEAEVIQRIHIDKMKLGKRDRRWKSEKAKGEVLKFTYNGEVWLDEMDSYRVDAKSCPEYKEASL